MKLTQEDINPKISVETAIKMCKRYVLLNIEEFCDSDSLNQIETIYFGDDLEYGMDFQIEYSNGNADLYSYKENVLPKITFYS